MSDQRQGKAFLDWQVRDAELRFLAAPGPEKWAKALRVIDAKFERGDFQMIQDLDEVTRAALARALIHDTYPPIKTPRP